MMGKSLVRPSAPFNPECCVARFARNTAFWVEWQSPTNAVGNFPKNP